MVLRRAIQLITVALLAGVVWTLLTAHLEEVVDPASLLPEDTLVLIDVPNPVKTFQTFRASRFGKRFEAIQWFDVLAQLGVDADLVQGLRVRTAAMIRLLQSRVFHEVSGRRAVLALVSADSATGSNGLEPILISRPTRRASLVNLLLPLYMRAGRLQSQKYLGREIRTFRLESGRNVFMTVTDGFVITAFSQAVLRQCLDLSLARLTSGKSGLRKNGFYATLRLRARNNERDFVYVDLEHLRPFLQSSPLVDSGAGQGGYAEFPLLQAFTHFCLYRGKRGNVSRYSVIARISPDLSDLKGLTSLLNHPPSIPGRPGVVPADLTAMYWSNNVDPAGLGRSVRQNRSTTVAGLANDFEKWLFARADIRLDTFLSLFGSEFTVMVTSVWTEGFVPIPKLCFIISLRQEDRVREIFAKLLPDDMVRTWHAGAREFNSVLLADGLIQPAYAFVDGHLIVADDRRQMMLMLDESTPGLVTDNLFQKVDVGFGGPANAVLFVRNRELTGFMREMVVWTSALLALNDQNGHKTARVVLEQVVPFLLEGLEMFAGTAGRMYTADGELVIETALVSGTDN